MIFLGLGLVLCKTCYARLHGPQVKNFCDSFLFLPSGLWLLKHFSVRQPFRRKQVRSHDYHFILYFMHSFSTDKWYGGAYFDIAHRCFVPHQAQYSSGTPANFQLILLLNSEASKQLLIKKKVPSEMEVVPRYTLLTLLAVLTPFTLFTLFKCFGMDWWAMSKMLGDGVMDWSGWIPLMLKWLLEHLQC